jgi:hypothetical protein
MFFCHLPEGLNLKLTQLLPTEKSDKQTNPYYSSGLFIHKGKRKMKWTLPNKNYSPASPPRCNTPPHLCSITWTKGYLDRYHCNFPKLKIYHYNSSIRNHTIIILTLFEIYRYLPFQHVSQNILTKLPSILFFLRRWAPAAPAHATTGDAARRRWTTSSDATRRPRAPHTDSHVPVPVATLPEPASPTAPPHAPPPADRGVAVDAAQGAAAVVHRRPGRSMAAAPLLRRPPLRRWWAQMSGRRAAPPSRQRWRGVVPPSRPASPSPTGCQPPLGCHGCGRSRDRPAPGAGNSGRSWMVARPYLDGGACGARMRCRAAAARSRRRLHLRWVGARLAPSLVSRGEAVRKTRIGVIWSNFF